MATNKKPNNVCTLEEFEQYKSIHQDFVDRSNLSECKPTKLAEQLRCFWPRLVTIACKLGISFDNKDLWILTTLIFGDKMPTFLTKASYPAILKGRISQLDVQLTEMKIKEAERKLHLVMIRLREQFNRQAEAISSVPTKEQPWADVAPGYLFNSEAIKLADGKISIKKLGKLLKPDGTMRYMRKAHRCKVHIEDFRTYIKTLGPDMFSEEAFDKYYEGAEARKKEIRHDKQPCE